MLLSVGGQSAQDDTDNETHTTAYNGWTYVGSHNGYYSYSTYYQQEFTQTDILNGPVQVTFALDAANLADLGADGLLDFQISALLGQFTFESISLTAEFQPQTVAVTGPGSTAGTAALLALLFARRRQQRQRGKAAA